jgi:predicted dehydrogenase
MKIRFGVTGTGHWARAVHLPGLQSRPDVELVGLWGRDPEKSREIADERGIAAFARFDDMLDAVDAVSIAVSPEVQGGLALAAARAGKHLLLEKPLSCTLESAEDIAAVVAHNGLAAVVFFMRRFVPEIESAVQVARTQNWIRGIVRVHSAVLSTDSPYARSAWRHAPGAEAWDIGPHVLSILIPILGPVVRIAASRESPHITLFTTWHDRGAIADVSVTLQSKPEAAGIEYRFTAGAGTLVLPEPAFSRSNALAAAADELIANIRDGQRAHRCDARFGLDVVRILAAADQSVATGKAVEVRG